MKIEKIETFPLFYRLPKPYGDANGMKPYHWPAVRIWKQPLRSFPF
ncbi:hypothetical protein [Paenibacillus oralis]